jgi:hypothetical protein
MLKSSRGCGGDLEGEGGCQQGREQGHEGARGAHAAGHSHIGVAQQHRVDHMDDAVGALDVGPRHQDALALPLQVIACKVKTTLLAYSVRSNILSKKRDWKYECFFKSIVNIFT